jgi:hypothetical protein
MRPAESGLTQILAELAAREPIFYRAEFGTTRADFERMTLPEFWEVGASGRRYSREYVLNELERRSASPQEEICETSGFECQRLAEEVYLLTYTLLQDSKRLTRRSTIWKRLPDGWKIAFHQGTVVADV